MRVYLFFKIALVFLALDSCGGCEPEDLLDLECQAQKAEDISAAEDATEILRQELINQDLSEEEFQKQLIFLEQDLEFAKETISSRPCD